MLPFGLLVFFLFCFLGGGGVGSGGGCGRQGRCERRSEVFVKIIIIIYYYYYYYYYYFFFLGGGGGGVRVDVKVEWKFL